MTQLNKQNRQKRRARRAEAKVLAEIAGRLAPEVPMPRSYDDVVDAMCSGYNWVNKPLVKINTIA